MSRTDLPQAIKERGMEAHYLYEVRNLMGLSQSEMAEVLGLSSYTYISNLESGRQNFSRTLVKCMQYVFTLWSIEGQIKPHVKPVPVFVGGNNEE